ncbi:MAG: serine protease [Pseudomonadota bacterium]
MEDNLRFVTTTDVIGCAGITFNNELVILQYEDLANALMENGRPDLIRHFACPVVGRDGDGGIKSVSWYTTLKGDGIGLFDGVTNPVDAIESLRSVITDLGQFLKNPTFGPLLARAMVVPCQDDILNISGEIVFVKWGFVPDTVGQSVQDLRAHWSKTLGSLTGYPLTFIESDARTEDPIDSLKAKDKIAEEEIDSVNTPELPEMIADVITVAPLVQKDFPWYQRGSTWGICAVLLLLCGMLLAWLIGPIGNPSSHYAVALKDQAARNKALERQRAVLSKSLQGTPCPTDLPDEYGWLADPNESLDAPANKYHTGDSQDDSNSLVKSQIEIIKAATVLVQTDKGSGSAFFVNPSFLMTNRHVVEGSTDILLISKNLDKPVRAVVKAMSTAAGEDFALLEVPSGAVPNSVSLVFSDKVDVITPVRAAGYPGFDLIEDKGYRDFRVNGDLSKAPGITVTTGEVCKYYQEDRPRRIVHTAIVSFGNSGGPLLDFAGRVVGINTAIRLDKKSTRQANYALGSHSIVDFLKKNGITAKTDFSSAEE